MSARPLTPDALAALIERFPLDRAAGKAPAEVADAQLQLLLARMVALTDAVRGAGFDDSARLASRILLSDLAGVAAQFRGSANAMRPPLAQALEDLRDALGRCDVVFASTRE